MSKKDDVEDVFFLESHLRKVLKVGLRSAVALLINRRKVMDVKVAATHTYLQCHCLHHHLHFGVILNLILCQIRRMDTIDAGMPIFCQAFCSDRRNIDIEDILTWPRLKQRRFTARDIPEMVTYQLRNPSGNIAALSRNPRHNTNTASQPKQQFGLRGIGRFFPIIFSNPVFIFVYLY